MIKYNLVCKQCNNSFDSWFASSREFDKLKKLKHINCYYCNSLKVEKSLMAPNVVSLKNVNTSTDEVKFLKVKKKIKEYQKFIKENFEYVGENFVFEARSIHYNNKKKSKGIFGSASKEDLQELREEGIDTQMIPWVDDSNN